MHFSNAESFRIQRYVNMLLNENNPRQSLYYLGALVLQILKRKPQMDFFDLYEELNQIESVSVKILLYVLD